MGTVSFSCYSTKYAAGAAAAAANTIECQLGRNGSNTKHGMGCTKYWYSNECTSSMVQGQQVTGTADPIWAMQAGSVNTVPGNVQAGNPGWVRPPGTQVAPNAGWVGTSTVNQGPATNNTGGWPVGPCTWDSSCTGCKSRVGLTSWKSRNTTAT
ncbi:hypothetical protein Tco_1225116 [Tanacetum coccineum]